MIQFSDKRNTVIIKEDDIIVYYKNCDNKITLQLEKDTIVLHYNNEIDVNDDLQMLIDHFAAKEKEEQLLMEKIGMQNV